MQLSSLGQQFIAGERSASAPATLESLNAADGSGSGVFFSPATAQEVSAAAEAAAAAFPLYSQTGSPQRAAFLQQIAGELDALGEDFLHIVQQETALPLARLRGERERTSGQLRLFAQFLQRGDSEKARIDRAQPQRQPLPRADLRQYQQAIGPVAVFGASNFPLAFSTAGGDSAAALAAGCPIVFKAHPGHMRTAECVAAAIERARLHQGLPAGVFNMIYGDRVGAGLVSHPAIQAVGFTGSLRGGQALMRLAQQRPQPIPVFAEMSSINPLVVLPQALAQRGAEIASGCVSSFTLGGGQFCTKPGFIVVRQGPGLEVFLQQLAEQTRGTAAQTLLNPTTLDHYRQGLERWQAHPGLTLLASGPDSLHHAAAQLYQADARLLLESQHLLLQQEVFGPVTVVVVAADDAGLHQLLARLTGQLTATLHYHPGDEPQIATLLPLLSHKAGRVLFNSFPTGVEVCEAMVHGGPWPATSDPRGTSVGTLAIERFQRPVCLQDCPAALLPPALQDANPLGLLRLVDGTYCRDALTA